MLFVFNDMNKYIFRPFFLVLGFTCAYNLTSAQVDFYDLSSVQEIEVYFSQSDWDYQLDTAKHGDDGYIIADYVRINGVQFDDAGVKYKGNSSYDSTYTKNPVHIELNHVIPQSYQGFTDIKLGNNYADPSVIREVLAYSILSNYMYCPRSNFARLYINGSYIGLYSNDESINKNFCSRNFNSSSGTFFKCNPIVTPGPTTKSNLKYIPGGDSTVYSDFYELKSDSGWDDLINLCDSVTNNPGSLESVLDMDRVLWMLAFNSVLVNLDSYTGVFPFVGSGGTSMGSLNISNMQTLSPVFHENDPYWPLINAVMNDPSRRKQFIAHARTINDENFVNGNYITTAQQLQQTADAAVLADTNSFFSYAQFQGGLDNDYQVGNYMVPGIQNLMNSRVSYLQSFPEFQAVPPQIVTVTPSVLQPTLNQQMYITAQVNNASEVYLGYRSSVTDVFVKVPMLDDGNHNDGMAGDQIYGAEISISSLLTQYYVYAENNNAAIFSPVRAEYEFYTLQTQWNYPSAGDIVINEFVAYNINGVANEYGVRADWIEFYNNSTTEISLYGLYITDNFDRRAKFGFPEDATIPAKGYFTVWADESASSPQYVHTNFRLAAEGEQLMLSDGFSLVLDSITYGQQLDDVSTGRCPDGTGSFQFIGIPSFNSKNCVDIEPGLPGWESLYLFPNPASDKVYVNTNVTPEIDEIKIYNSIGSLIRQFKITDNYIDLISFSEGIYFAEFKNNATGKTKMIKLVKARNR